MNKNSLKLAYAPMSISLVLEDEIDIGRGEIIDSKENIPYSSKEVEAMVCWMNETPLKIGRKYILKHTSRTTKTVIQDIKYRINIDSLKENQTQTLKLNEIGMKNAFSNPIEALDWIRSTFLQRNHSLLLEEYLLTVGKRIKQIRNTLGINQQELADKSDLDRTYISAVENGRQNISLSVTLRIAQGLNTTVEQITNQGPM